MVQVYYLSAVQYKCVYFGSFVFLLSEDPLELTHTGKLQLFMSFYHTKCSEGQQLFSVYLCSEAGHV